MTFVEALVKLRPGAAWSCHGGVYATLDWEDTEQTKPTEAEILATMAQPRIPASVHMWQAKAALQSAGKLDAANAAVAGSGNQNIIMAWEWAPEISRDSPAVAAVGAAIGLASADLDALFIAADAISV